MFVGLENYEMMMTDEVFWKVVGNNLTYASCTIPFSISIALLMAVWVNGKLPLRDLGLPETTLARVCAANLLRLFDAVQHPAR